jgi:hypothetical protein
MMQPHHADDCLCRHHVVDQEPCRAPLPHMCGCIPKAGTFSTPCEKEEEEQPSFLSLRILEEAWLFLQFALVCVDMLLPLNLICRVKVGKNILGKCGRPHRVGMDFYFKRIVRNFVTTLDLYKISKYQQ